MSDTRPTDDTPRIATEATSEGAAPEGLERLARAWTLLYLTPGTPLLYYGDELALLGGADPNNRSPMPWGGDLSDLAIEQALSTLHARVVAALVGWTPQLPGIGEVSEEGAEFRLYDADESAKPAGEFAARFSVLCIGGLGIPYAA